MTIPTPDFFKKVSLDLPTKPTQSTTDSYKCTADGFIYVCAARGSSTGNSFKITVNGQTCCPVPASKAYQDYTVLIPVKKDDVIMLLADGTSATWEIQKQEFYPLRKKSNVPKGYREATGLTFASNTYYKIDNFYLKGSDTVQFSMVTTSGSVKHNVFGCYTSTSATNNYSFYINSGSVSTKYLRYNGGTYNSYASTNTRYDVTITPTGSTGLYVESTWTPQDFECSSELCIGTASESTSTLKFAGDFLGHFVVQGRLNLIPCERLSDNVVGYYDTISKTFYEPTGDSPTVIDYV